MYIKRKEKPGVLTKPELGAPLGAFQESVCCSPFLVLLKGETEVEGRPELNSCPAAQVLNRAPEGLLVVSELAIK